MGLNVFIIQYPASVKVSTIARKRPDGNNATDETGTWKGALNSRLENLGVDTTSIANGKFSSSSNAKRCVAVVC